MIYFEFVNSLKMLEKSRDDAMLSKIMNANIELYGDMRYRFSVRIVRFINNMLDKIYGAKINEIFSKLYDKDEFELLIIDLKNEINYIYNYTKIKSIPNECLDDIISVYNDICNKYNTFIIRNVAETYGEDFSSQYEIIMDRKEV